MTDTIIIFDEFYVKISAYNSYVTFLVSLCVALRLFYYSGHKKRLPEINQTAWNLQLDNVLLSNPVIRRD